MQLAGKSDRDCKINAPKTSEMIACWKGLCEADSDISEIPTSCLISLSTHPFTVSSSSPAASARFLLFVPKKAIADFDKFYSGKLDHQRVDCISLKSITSTTILEEPAKFAKLSGNFCTVWSAVGCKAPQLASRFRVDLRSCVYPARAELLAPADARCCFFRARTLATFARMAIGKR